MREFRAVKHMRRLCLALLALAPVCWVLNNMASWAVYSDSNGNMFLLDNLLWFVCCWFPAAAFLAALAGRAVFRWGSARRRGLAAAYTLTILAAALAAPSLLTAAGML